MKESVVQVSLQLLTREAGEALVSLVVTKKVSRAAASPYLTVVSQKLQFALWQVAPYLGLNPNILRQFGLLSFGT